MKHVIEMENVELHFSRKELQDILAFHSENVLARHKRIWLDLAGVVISSIGIGYMLALLIHGDKDAK